MDAHYHQVMKAREQQAAGPAKKYFAYSTILDREAFDVWAKEHSYQFFKLPGGQVAKALDLDLVFDFPSRWWRGRVAGLQENAGSSVYGILFEIDPKDWPIIQHKEGFITGMCVEKVVQLEVNGQKLEATAFATSPGRKSLDGPISPGFVEALVRGAEASQLPQDYIVKLKAIKG